MALPGCGRPRSSGINRGIDGTRDVLVPGARVGFRRMWPGPDWLRAGAGSDRVNTRRVPFSPIGPAALALALARWIDGRSEMRQRIGLDGLAECGSDTLAEEIAAELSIIGRPTVRVSTAWWWRPAALRLEHGREDVESLLSGWVDVGALRREVLNPLGPVGTGGHLTRLRDPGTDRSIRQSRAGAADSTVLLASGPFLLTHELPWEGVIHLQVSPATVARALPPERRWWVGGYLRYLNEFQPSVTADVVVSYDHPATPAVRWSGPGVPGSSHQESPG